MRRIPVGLFRDHDFRQHFIANTISQLGTQVTQIALPLVAILTLDASPFEVGLLVTLEFAAFLLIGLPAGAWVDRMRKRSVLIAGDIGRAVLLGSVPAAYWLDALAMPQIYAVALLTGACTVFFDVAYQSYLPHLVGRERLVEGNAKLEAVRGVNQIAGPTAAGLVVQALTAPIAILADAVSFVGSAVYLGFIRKREPKPDRQPHAHLGREIAEGLRFVLGNRLLRAIAFCTGTGNFFGSMVSAMFIVLLADELRLSAGTIGLVFSVGAVGGLLGAFVATSVASRLGQGPAIWLSLAVTGPFWLLIPLAEPGWLLWAAAGGYAVAGVGTVVYNITQVSFRQGLTPEPLLGRMNATMRFLVWGTLPLGSLLGGILGELVGVRETIWIAAVASCLPFLWTYLSPLRSMRDLPVHEGGSEPGSEPQPQPQPVDQGLARTS